MQKLAVVESHGSQSQTHFHHRWHVMMVAILFFPTMMHMPNSTATSNSGPPWVLPHT
jgi:hypothetical protein